MSTESKKFNFQEDVETEEKRWLQRFEEKREFSDWENQEILRGIWGILLRLYPLDRGGETTLKITSARLVELGLVSEKAAEEIGDRRVRKTNGFEKIKSEDEPLNIVVINKTPEGFSITKTYVSEEQYLMAEGTSLRKDSVVEEEALLTREGDLFKLKIRAKEAMVHLHTLGRTWVPRELSSEPNQYKEVEVTSKDLVRTLVLLVEGLY